MPKPKKKTGLAGLASGYAESPDTVRSGTLEGYQSPPPDTRYSPKEWRTMRTQQAEGTKFIGDIYDPYDRQPQDINQPVPLIYQEEMALKPGSPDTIGPVRSPWPQKGLKGLGTMARRRRR